MNELCQLSQRPIAFFLRYVRMRPIAHSTILLAVLAAVTCSVTAQYGVKLLVDTLSAAGISSRDVWIAFAALAALIAADNLLWRVASLIAARTFVGVTGDVRRDLFRHLTGHAPSFFADRLPGTVTSRVTATANAVYTVENMFVWNVLPPCAATFGAIAYLFTVSGTMAIGLVVIAGILVAVMFKLAAAGGPLHHDFAAKAATVDGEMVDVIGNLPVVWAFCGIGREHHRFDDTVDRELRARRQSLLYLERLRIGHAIVTCVLAVGLLGWALVLWERGAATTGQVVLTCTLGLSILHATRDLAVALVDVTQHMARLAEALATLLVPHDLHDHPTAVPLPRHGASIAFDKVSFHYPDGRGVFRDFSLRISPDQRVGLVGQSGGGKSTIFSLLQRFYDVQGGRILIGGEDIARVTQHSLRSATAVVPQDISLFHRSLLENVRYGRPEATDEEVMQALAAARCTDFVGALPQGVDTLVGDRGIKLSPGQRQRIAIARAFLKDAAILLLDEATSALDGESEEAIRQALDRLMRGRTVIAIAHRLSTLRNFDRIVLLRAGEILEDGSPERLLRRDGAFRRLIEREMSGLIHRAA